MKSLWGMISYVKNYKKHIALVMLFNMLFVIFNLLTLILFIPFLRLIFNPEAIQKVAEPVSSMDFQEYWETWYNYKMYTIILAEGKVGALTYICIVIGLCFLFKNLFAYLAMFFLAPVRNGIVKSLRQDLHVKIMRLHLGFFSDERKGDIMARNTTDVQEVEWSVVAVLNVVFKDPLNIILTLTTLFYLSWQLTLISLLLLPVSALVISRIGRSLKRTSLKAQNKLGELFSALEENLSGLRIIKAFSNENVIDARYDKINEEHNKLSIRAFRKRDLASPLNEFLGACVMLTLVWFGGKMILGESNTSGMTGSTFLAFIVTFSQLLRPISGIANGISAVNKGLASVERINKILEAEEVIKDPENPLIKTEFEKEITYKNIHFSYGNEEVINNISLKIPKGKTIALVGESGGGKSTLADLLPRFYDVTKGKILIDNVNIKDLSLSNLRSFLGIVTQESILFNDTVANNIKFGLDATDEEVQKAAKIANAHVFIKDLPNGYNTNIGDRGGKLSGGQKQRISIARAVLKNPPIMILDEATSALDTESEKLVQEALYKLMENRTSIVIAHRLSTIQHADEIIVLQKGQIVERGTHKELVAQNGVYTKLSELQGFA